MPVLLNATIFANPYPKSMQLSLYGNTFGKQKDQGLPERVRAPVKPLPHNQQWTG